MGFVGRQARYGQPADMCTHTAQTQPYTHTSTLAWNAILLCVCDFTFISCLLSHCLSRESSFIPALPIPLSVLNSPLQRERETGEGGWARWNKRGRKGKWYKQTIKKTEPDKDQQIWKYYRKRRQLLTQRNNNQNGRRQLELQRVTKRQTHSPFLNTLNLMPLDWMTLKSTASSFDVQLKILTELWVEGVEGGKTTEWGGNDRWG